MFSGIFACVLDSYFKCFICLFFMLQLLHSDVLKVDRVLYLRCAWEAIGGAGDVWCSVGDVQDDTGPLLVRSLASPTGTVRTLAPGSDIPDASKSGRTLSIIGVEYVVAPVLPRSY
jgi:hypothetical protein